MSARGHNAGFQLCHRALAALAVAGLFIIMLIGVDGVRAKDRDGWNARFDEKESRDAQRRQQAEIERQRREQEREQKQASRQAQREQARVTPVAQPDVSRGQLSPQSDAVIRPGNGPGQTLVSQPKNVGGVGGDKRANDIDTDAADVNGWMLTDTERSVRQIDKQRRLDLAEAQKQSEVLRQKEQARSDRIRENSMRQREQGIVTRLPPPTKQPSPIVQPMPVSIDKNEPVKAVAKRRPSLLDGVQSQASHLGMGRDAFKADDQASPREEKQSDAKQGEAASSGTAEPKVAQSAGQSDAAQEGVTKELEGEVVVTEISPEDAKKAEAAGFVVSEPVEVNGMKTKVRKLSSPGKLREEVERELHKSLPFLNATPNYSYSIFMDDLGEREGALPDASKSSPASSEPCPKGTCFGSGLIRWSRELGACAKNVKIGIIDTSFDISHPTFKTLDAIQADFLDGEQPSEHDWHGTAVLSLLAGDPDSGTPGLVPEATFLLATAFRSDTNGNASTKTNRLVDALDWLDRLEVDVVNMSFSGPEDKLLRQSIERMSKKGVVFIAAAGNMGPTAKPSYPAAYPNVVAVTAVNRKSMSYKSANRGSYVDVAAPGVDILTALPHARQGLRTGTSFAVPFVTAIVAARAKDPEIRISAVANDLEDFATEDLGPPGPDTIYGRGLALAPQRCRQGGGIVARATVPFKPGDDEPPSSPVLQPWSATTTTTFFNAGAGFAP